MDYSFLDNKFESLDEIYDKYGYNKDSIAKYEYLSEYILNLYNYKIVEKDDVNKLFWNGNYYQNVEKDYIKMKEYYLMAIDMNDSDAMSNLGYYYQSIEKDYVKMLKYYIMAIEMNNSNTMCNLGFYYQDVEKDYNKMKKYYLMAIEINSSDAMSNLGLYYKTIEKDYIKMKEYYLMAIEMNNSNAMCNLGWYYQTIEMNYTKMKKYYLMAIDLNNSDAMNNLDWYYQNKLLEFYCLLYKVESKNNIINEKIDELMENEQVLDYCDKIKVSERLNNYKNCVICYDENCLHINFDCGHEVCIDCYSKMKKCFYNCA